MYISGHVKMRVRRTQHSSQERNSARERAELSRQKALVVTPKVQPIQSATCHRKLEEEEIFQESVGWR